MKITLAAVAAVLSLSAVTARADGYRHSAGPVVASSWSHGERAERREAEERYERRLREEREREARERREFSRRWGGDRDRMARYDHEQAERWNRFVRDEDRRRARD